MSTPVIKAILHFDEKVINLTVADGCKNLRRVKIKKAAGCNNILRLNVVCQLSIQNDHPPQPLTPSSTDCSQWE